MRYLRPLRPSKGRTACSGGRFSRQRKQGVPFRGSAAVPATAEARRAGVVLQHNLQSADLQPPHGGGPQRTEPGRNLRPYRKLVTDEFVYIDHNSDSS